MVITTYTKGKNIYANASKSRRIGKRVVKERQVSLGKVIDLEKHIFQNRKHGLYKYDPETERITELPKQEKKKSSLSCIDFGDSFFLDRLMEKLGIKEIVSSVEGIDSQSLLALILFYLECQAPNSSASDWFEGNYASFLYPDAKMDDQRISELLSVLGKEETKSAILRKYYEKETFKTGTKVIIDSTGIINDIHCSFTAVCNHNGKVSTCIRLITVIREEDSKPIYFRMVPGSTLDSATLKKTIVELGKYGIQVSMALLDVGYCTASNIRRLMTMKIVFITRLDAKTVLFRNLKKKCFDDLERKENFVRYEERFFYIRRIDDVPFCGKKIHAYVCLDKTSQAYDTIRMSERKNIPENAQACEELMNDGFFILISSEEYGADRILPQYYLRQRIEQSYDLVKNTTNIQPIRSHSESTINGHLLVSFLCQIIGQEIQNTFKGEHLSQERLLLSLRNQKAEVYPAEILPLETKRIATLAYKKMKIEVPETIKLRPKKKM